MAILIKRYANRKLYNTQSSRYITLKGISELIDAGEEVRVVDNETGEDITNVALSQILVDSERSNRDVSRSLLSQLIERGGDVLYGAIRRGMDDASEGIGEIQDRFRKIVRNAETEGGRLGDWVAFSAPDFDHHVQNAVERVFKLLDLPRRSDVDALNRNLTKVAAAVERLEKAFAARSEAPEPDEESEPANRA
jgi:polyhydroxyalkanoate synthesis repressor PhaR